MLAHAIEDADFATLDAADFIAEWKWDGIRVQAVSGRDERGHIQTRLYSRSGEDITKSFPDLLPSLHLPGAIDGELLVLRDGRVQTFNVLQQRLNRKVVSPKLMKDFPIHLRAYDLLGDGDDDLRELPFAERRARLEAFVAKLDDARKASLLVVGTLLASPHILDYDLVVLAIADEDVVADDRIIAQRIEVDSLVLNLLVFPLVDSQIHLQAIIEKAILGSELQRIQFLRLVDVKRGDCLREAPGLEPGAVGDVDHVGWSEVVLKAALVGKPREGLVSTECL